MTNTVWRCEQVRAGEVTSSVVFESEEQATRFVTRMRLAEPDLNVIWRVERVEANAEQK
jgi:hypothetical protein